MGIARREERFLPASTSHTDAGFASAGRISACLQSALVWGLLSWGVVFPPCASGEGFGPFPVRNFHPLQQLVLQIPGDRANVVAKGTIDVRLELAETAAIYREVSPQASVTAKFETLRSGAFLRYGVTEKLELALEVPVLYRYRGFMEGMIKAVERATTGLAPARKALSNVGYAYNVTRGGQQVISGAEGVLGLGDATMMAKYQVLSETSTLPAVSIRGAIKLPTGDEGQFFGSGSPDFGIGLAAEKSIGSRWILYGNVNGVFPTGRIGGMPLQATISGLAAVEYLWTENLSLTLQFDYYSPPFHGVGLKALDRGVTELVTGFNYRISPQWLWQVYGVENTDLITGSAPDFTLATLFTYRFRS